MNEEVELKEEAEVKQGIVKWFSEHKGYGFIQGENGEKDCFMHHSELPEGYEPKEGEKVKFTPHKTDKGLSALKIRKS